MANDIISICIRLCKIELYMFEDDLNRFLVLSVRFEIDKKERMSTLFDETFV